MQSSPYIIKYIILILTLGMLSACTGETRKLTDDEKIWMPRDRERMKKVRAGSGLLTKFFLRRDSSDEDIKGSFARANNYLWSASLEVLSNFPLASIDNKSGLIITEWYSSESKPSERFKITVLILSNKIEADAIKVSIHRQVIKSSRWINVNIEDKKTSAIERKIINKAIDLKTRSS
tara:strand:- start:656 stop:1189 length:534 start_codon:yes stop_codon:yes gene_type:complete